MIDTGSHTILTTIISGVGPTPLSIVFTPDGLDAYVTNAGPGTVSVIDTGSLTVPGSPISVGRTPSGIGITPDGTRVYVVNQNSNSVSVIDTALKVTVGAPIPVGQFPFGIALIPAASVNHPPVANAGLDQTKDEGSIVELDGTASSDPDNDPLTYTWTQISGTPVTLLNANSPKPTFTAPQQPSHSQTTLIFQLVVDDGVASNSDTIAITVMDVDAPPACELAQANPATLWPPDNRLVSVEITGITDPDNDEVTVTVTSITQDEPVNGLGDGDVSPDAMIQSQGVVLLRAERSGLGNGRVYQVQFKANDSFGAQCTESVKVCVPHDRQPATCVDDGQRFDATKP